VLEKGNTALGATFLFGLALAIWSANAGVKAVIDALNVVYEERDRVGHHRRRRQTAGPPRRGNGRYARGRSSGRVERTLVVRINIDAKLAAPGGGETEVSEAFFAFPP
jgi:hypothetical protein